MEYHQKNTLDNIFFYKFADIISNKHLDPNVITTINIIPSFLALFFLYNKNISYFLVFLIIRLFLDCLDGFVARKYNKVSNFGQQFDKYLDIFFYLILLIILLQKSNIIIILLSIIIFTILLILRYDIPFLTILLKYIEENTIISVPIISLLIYYYT